MCKDPGTHKAVLKNRAATPLGTPLESHGGGGGALGTGCTLCFGVGGADPQGVGGEVGAGSGGVAGVGEVAGGTEEDGRPPSTDISSSDSVANASAGS